MLDKLTEGTFLLYAAKCYMNPCYSQEEFADDLKRFNYIKRLLCKYQETGELRERLILNHIIILYNVFSDGATKMLLLKLKDQRHLIKPFLVLLNRMPDKIYNVGEESVIHSSDILMDPKIVEVLRKV